MSLKFDIKEELQLKKNVGRPFKGNVAYHSKEYHVPKRRAVFRAFKKFYAKLDIKNNRT